MNVKVRLLLKVLLYIYLVMENGFLDLVCPSLWETMVFEFLLGALETLLCSVSALQVKTVLLRDSLQLLMLFAGTMRYMEQKNRVLIIFYNDSSFLFKY
jgi:hypothetical protein